MIGLGFRIRVRATVRVIIEIRVSVRDMVGVRAGGLELMIGLGLGFG